MAAAVVLNIFLWAYFTFYIGSFLPPFSYFCQLFQKLEWDSKSLYTKSNQSHRKLQGYYSSDPVHKAHVLTELWIYCHSNPSSFITENPSY